MTKKYFSGTPVDLKQFFEASIRALQNDKEPLRIGNQGVRRNSPLVQKTQIDWSPGNRAVADAAKALTALWRMQNCKRSI